MNHMASVKPFTWSYSKLKNYETCPKKHYALDIGKTVPQEESAQLAEGNEIHEALAARLGRQKAPLPMGITYLEKWCERIERGAQGGRLDTEVKTAFTRDFAATAYFGSNVWFRGKIDVLAVKGAAAMVVDWKTGRVVEDTPQLALMAQAVFSMFPEVQAVRTEFIWTAADETTRQDYTRAGMVRFWGDFMPRVAALEEAWTTQHYPPTPNGLCKRWCPVTACPHHGIGSGSAT